MLHQLRRRPSRSRLARAARSLRRAYFGLRLLLRGAPFVVAFGPCGRCSRQAFCFPARLGFRPRSRRLRPPSPFPAVCPKLLRWWRRWQWFFLALAGAAAAALIALLVLFGRFPSLE